MILYRSYKLKFFKKPKEGECKSTTKFCIIPKKCDTHWAWFEIVTTVKIYHYTTNEWVTINVG